MINQNNFLMNEIPWHELNKIGISEEAFLELPKDSLDKILTGQLSPLMKLKFMDDQGNTLTVPEKMKLSQNPDGTIPTKFSLQRTKEGNVQVVLHPKRNEINLTIGNATINQEGLERLKNMETIPMTVVKDGKDEKYYIQLDHDLNILQMTNEKSIVIPNAIGDVTLGENQIQQIRDGKPIELEVGDTKVTVGVDLNDRNGFKIVEGDMDEWKQRKLEQWDRITPGVRGYWKTSENGWEYQLHEQRDETIKQTAEIERETGRRLSQNETLDMTRSQSRGMRR